MLCFQTNKKRRSVKVTICLFKTLQAAKHGSNADRNKSGRSLLTWEAQGGCSAQGHASARRRAVMGDDG